VLTDPIQVAEADVARFAKPFPMNARPVQKTNRRFVLRSAEALRVPDAVHHEVVHR
jgi:carbonic anhydrase